MTPVETVDNDLMGLINHLFMWKQNTSEKLHHKHIFFPTAGMFFEIKTTQAMLIVAALAQV